ncbi:MAG: hypothetical protein U0Z44_10705 [Kouleothrix sp.]
MPGLPPSSSCATTQLACPALTCASVIAPPTTGWSLAVTWPVGAAVGVGAGATTVIVPCIIS